jgi:hypothetical protein
MRNVPVLKIANKFKLSYQLIYTKLNTFNLFINKMHQFFKESSPKFTHPLPEPISILKQIKTYKPYTEFQFKYIESNKRPCFMSKLFKDGRAPPIGISGI